ncbi:MAG: hypothetical protein IPI66_13110 [Chitinophagaceae bacterium]|nr:hypothetical protein [Chitinophagaceae bacterium]MBL0056877.1 hypothetical protein [Chitinophagaceae bacterium]
MDFKKLGIGGIVGGILFFGFGYLIYGMLLMDFMAKNPGVAGNVNRAEADMQFLYLAAGNLLSGFMMAYIFIRANVKTAVDGLITGGIVGFLLMASMDCVMYGTTTVMSKKMMAADVAAGTAMSAIIGAIVAMVMNMGKKEA